MKKTLSILVLVIIVICGYMMMKPKYYNDQEFVAKKTVVTFNEVNIRDTPNGDVLGKLLLNNNITLTGNFYKAIGNENNSKWVEITYNGQNAWITAEAVKWQ